MGKNKNKRSSLGGAQDNHKAKGERDRKDKTNKKRASLSTSSTKTPSHNKSHTTDDIAINRPTPLSPTFTKSAPATAPSKSMSRVPGTSIAVPRDQRADPTWLTQKMQALKSQAEVRPSFKAALSEEGDGDGDAVDDEGGNGGSDKKSRKKKNKNKAKVKVKVEPEDERETVSGSKSNTAAIGGEKSKQVLQYVAESPAKIEQRAQKNKKRRENARKSKEASKVNSNDNVRVETINGVQVHIPAGMAIPAVFNPLKRKLSHDANSNADLFSTRLDGETRAIKRLREAVPGVKVTRVTQRLQQELGTEPSDMAILAEAARDLIVDLAKAQMLQAMGGGSTNNGTAAKKNDNALHLEVLKMIKDHHEKLEKLERDVKRGRSKDKEERKKHRKASMAHRNEADQDSTSSEGASSSDSDSETDAGGEIRSLSFQGDAEKGKGEGETDDDDGHASASETSSTVSSPVRRKSRSTSKSTTSTSSESDPEPDALSL